MKTLIKFLFSICIFISVAHADTSDVKLQSIRASASAATITAGAGGYVLLYNNSTALRLRLCRFNNRTDQPITISFNGTDDDSPFVGSNTAEFEDWASNNILHTGSVYIKYSSSAPATGSFYMNCRY